MTFFCLFGGFCFFFWLCSNFLCCYNFPDKNPQAASLALGLDAHLKQGMLHKVAGGCQEELMPPRNLCHGHLLSSSSTERFGALSPDKPLNVFSSLDDASASRLPAQLALSVLVFPSQFGFWRLSQQGWWGSLGWEFQCADSCDASGAGAAGVCAAGSIQHWQDPALGDES